MFWRNKDVDLFLLAETSIKGIVDNVYVLSGQELSNKIDHSHICQMNAMLHPAARLFPDCTLIAELISCWLQLCV